MNLVLLPRLDGTGVLFDPLLRVLPSHFSPIVIKVATFRMGTESSAAASRISELLAHPTQGDYNEFSSKRD